MPKGKMHDKQRGKNFALLWVLVAFVALLYIMGAVKIGGLLGA
jgi:F0F1-type ATP synthase membrane subunit b/b'